ncbi:uncharacterized protein LOC124797898 isoform X1 [Schistocerca piceifrons]|uniref:uncharacterized protein LOC124797898 isoform X1 n=1 Tax=Schistocerca piceifrons TaxID=274613 RepID=UPI001F5F9A24|nr:uncharacterized protein LOC124797898 isoform X1 [Schistocerca piceifrons]
MATTAAALIVIATALLTASPAHGLPPTPVRRQVLPPVPGYIPVYIQHGDVAPEDTVELADLFRVAGDNLPPADVVSDALFGAPTVLSPNTSNGSTEAGSTSASENTSSQSASTVPAAVQDTKQPSSEDKPSKQEPANSEHGTPIASINGSAQSEADNAVGDPAGEDNSEVHEIINLEPFPDKVEIGADKLIEMLDASKMDAEESQSNNAEQTSPAFEGSADAEMPTTEATMSAK